MSTVTVDSTLVERPTVWGGEASQYKVAEVLAPNVPTLIAGGAGQAVTTSIVFSEANLPADLDYNIQAVASQACAVSYANKDTDGFDIVLTPLSSGVTLAAGTVDIIVTWSFGG